MSEDKKVQTEEKKDTDKGAAAVTAKAVFGGGPKKGGFQGGPRRPRRGNDKRRGQGDEMEQRILEIARVTRVMGGGKRMTFRACVAVGDKKKKQVGIGLGKGADVTIAVNKAVNRAKKELITIPMINDTIPHEVYNKTGAAKIIFKPAKKGKGVIAGGVVRIILELAGVKNISSKIIGSNNKVNNARCTINALASLHPVEQVEKKKKVEKVKEVKSEKKDK